MGPPCSPGRSALPGWSSWPTTSMRTCGPATASTPASSTGEPWPCPLPLHPAPQWHGHGEQASEVCPLQHRQDRLLHAHLPAAGAPGEEGGGQRCPGWEEVCVSLLPGARLPSSGQVAEEAWVLIEELSPKMTLEVASGLFELYLTLADIQRLWSSTPGRWVPCPPVPSPPVSRHTAPVSLLPLALPRVCAVPPVLRPPPGGLWSLRQDPRMCQLRVS